MIKILHLYPNLMNMYGDYANITVLKRHLEDQGQVVSINKKDIEDKYNLLDYDFIYMGSGTEANELIALKNIKKHERELKKCIKLGKVILFTGNAMELMGNSVSDQEGLGIFDFETSFTDKRYTGDVIGKSETFGEVVGFINKSSVIINYDINPLFTYVFTDENLKESKYEGFSKDNVFATHLIGPVLVKNPNFMKHIVQLLLPNGKKYKEINYKYEQDAYNITLNALKERM